MHLHRRLVAAALGLALSAMTALFGCRAFEPEFVIVNHDPETYVTGAPIAAGGGQFHFHVFWTGTDRDGSVERFVWALTDGTIQDPNTDFDEEDTRFNPAESITTLEIGNWTTRTDTIFNFQINNGSSTTADKTFHIVAVDDRGDFDRTPARLYFLSNALGVPALEFFRSLEPVAEFAFANLDTIGFANPFDLSWRGSTPNIASFTQEVLAVQDTVPPLDGLFGYKYRLPTDVDCDDAIQDCWNPQRFDPEQNRDASYFDTVDHLQFTNDGPSLAEVAHRRLGNGVHTLQVNTVDVAGVEVPAEYQSLNYVINYDPETYILGHEKPFDLDADGEIEPGEVLDYAQDPFYADPETYPFYKLYRPDGAIERVAFEPNARLPQRSVAVFKGIGWDDPRDVRFADISDLEASEFDVLFQGKFRATGKYLGGSLLYSFSTEYSTTAVSVWDDFTNPAIGAADTVSFIVGPFDYRFSMRTVDEHGRRDGTPDDMFFSGNYPPEVQCVEVVTDGAASGYPDAFCAAVIDTFFCSSSGAAVPGHPDWSPLRQVNLTPQTIFINPATGAIQYDGIPTDPGVVGIPGYYYEYELLLYAQDHEDERLFIPRESPLDQTVGDPVDRAFAWRYQITSHADSISNLIREGAGFDDLTQINFSLTDNYADNYDDNGVWRLPVEVFVPLLAVSASPSTFWAQLNSGAPPYNNLTPSQAAFVFDLAMRQMGLTTAQVITRDASTGEFRPDRCGYPYFVNTRAALDHGERCDVTYAGLASIARYEFFFAESELFEKKFVIKVVGNAALGGEVYPPLPE